MAKKIVNNFNLRNFQIGEEHHYVSAIGFRDPLKMFNFEFSLDKTDLILCDHLKTEYKEIRTLEDFNESNCSRKEGK